MKTQRKDYLAGKVSHQAYYGEIAKELGIKFTPEFLDLVRASNDPHLNDIGLKTWDRLGLSYSMSEAMRARGDNVSLAGKVCVLKAAAKAATS